MKNYLIIWNLAFMASPFCIKAQTGNTGIATTKPRTNLDINGTINTKNDIKLGGTDLNSGSSGISGDLISANGNNNPVWKNFDLPSGYGAGLVLNASYLKSTEIGISFDGTQNSNNLSVPYTEDQDILTAPSPQIWKEITGVAQTFTITKATSSTNISMQTLAQRNSGTNGSFGCGIYIDNKLKFVRTGTIPGASRSYRTLNLNASIPNLAVGNHTFRFACVERNIDTGVTISIGQPVINSTNLNSKMAATSVSIKVFEPMN